MADYTIKSGDTYPPLVIYLLEATEESDTKRFPNPDPEAADEAPWVRLMDLATVAPDSIRMIAKLASPSTTFDGPMVNMEDLDGPDDVGTVEGEFPGLGVPANRGHLRYNWNAGDTDVVGAGYELEAEVTWDSGATPPTVETFPNESQRNPTLDIDPDLD